MSAEPFTYLTIDDGLKYLVPAGQTAYRQCGPDDRGAFPVFVKEPKERIVRYTAAEVEAMVANGEDQSDPSAASSEDDEDCPVCGEPLEAGDLCSTDIELGTCHAECLDGVPVVDLDTGAPMDGPADTFIHREGEPVGYRWRGIGEWIYATRAPDGIDAQPLYLRPASPPPVDHLVGGELPADIVESLLSIGLVEWGQTHKQNDGKHIDDLEDTLRLTRQHFGIEDRETAIHGLYLEGTSVVLAHTGMSPNSPQHARILAGAWNQLVELAKTQRAALSAEVEG